MSDQNDRKVRILLSILFFPIGLIMALAGVRTRIIALCFGGFYLWMLTVIVVVGLVGGEADVAQGGPVQAAPIPTLELTATPIPTPMAQTCPTGEESLYFLAVADNLAERREHMTRIADLSFQGSNDPLLMIDDKWKLEMGIALGMLIASAEEIDGMDPPISVRSIHQDLLHVGGYHRNAATLYSQGIDNINATMIVSASDHISIAGEYMTSATQKVATFCDVDPSSSIQQSPVPEVVQVSHSPSGPIVKATSVLTSTPTPTSVPTPTPTTMPSPTPDVPLMSREECDQVVQAYMDGIIESAILDGADDPMTFRYWAEGFSDSMPLGYTLQYQEYSGFGEKPEHHRVIGHVLVHWWNNNVQEYMVEFFPHPATCLPRKDAIYTGWGVEPWFEYEDVEFVILNLTDAANNLEYHLRGVEEPTGIVEVD